MKKLRIALVSLLFICLAALMVVPALLPAPEAPVSADLMPTFDQAAEGTAVLILEAAPAPTPVAAPEFPMYLMVVGLTCSTSMVLGALSMRRITSQGDNGLTTGSGIFGNRKCPISGRLLVG